MDGIQIGCCVVMLALAILLDVLCRSHGYTLLCLSFIAVLGVSLSYEYRKKHEEAKARKRQYQQRIHQK